MRGERLSVCSPKYKAGAPGMDLEEQSYDVKYSPITSRITCFSTSMVVDAHCASHEMN